VVFIISALDPEVDDFKASSSLQFSKMFASWLTHFNAAVNPFIYAYRIKAVRDTMRGAFIRKNENESRTQTDVTSI
jgi:hypothetical protein